MALCPFLQLRGPRTTTYDAVTRWIRLSIDTLYWHGHFDRNLRVFCCDTCCGTNCVANMNSLFLTVCAQLTPNESFELPVRSAPVMCALCLVSQRTIVGETSMRSLALAYKGEGLDLSSSDPTADILEVYGGLWVLAPRRRLAPRTHSLDRRRVINTLFQELGLPVSSRRSSNVLA